MKIIFKDYNGNDVYTAELTITNEDMLIIEPIPIAQPRNPIEAINQIAERTNSIYPRMKLYTINNVNTEIKE